jgi:hypothetical protein
VLVAKGADAAETHHGDTSQECRRAAADTLVFAVDDFGECVEHRVLDRVVQTRVFVEHLQDDVMD